MESLDGRLAPSGNLALVGASPLLCPVLGCFFDGGLVGVCSPGDFVSWMFVSVMLSLDVCSSARRFDLGGPAGVFRFALRALFHANACVLSFTQNMCVLLLLGSRFRGGQCNMFTLVFVTSTMLCLFCYPVFVRPLGWRRHRSGDRPRPLVLDSCLC